jgi:hypothetical protein
MEDKKVNGELRNRRECFSARPQVMAPSASETFVGSTKIKLRCFSDQNWSDAV